MVLLLDATGVRLLTWPRPLCRDPLGRWGSGRSAYLVLLIRRVSYLRGNQRPCVITRSFARWEGGCCFHLAEETKDVSQLLVPLADYDQGEEDWSVAAEYRYCKLPPLYRYLPNFTRLGPPPNQPLQNITGIYGIYRKVPEYRNIYRKLPEYTNVYRYLRKFAGIY